MTERFFCSENARRPSGVSVWHGHPGPNLAAHRVSRRMEIGRDQRKHSAAPVKERLEHLQELQPFLGHFLSASHIDGQTECDVSSLTHRRYRPQFSTLNFPSATKRIAWISSI